VSNPSAFRFIGSRLSEFLPSGSMGWFSRSTSEQSAAATRQDRQKCWESRDQYFECLDTVGILTAGEEGPACSKSKSQYEKNCAKSWVGISIQILVYRTDLRIDHQIDYFNKRRVLAEQQKDMLAQSQVQAQAVKRKVV
jgi:cytochrome c oxidase assembly factor 6